jgi:hypothetical protein
LRDDTAPPEQVFEFLRECRRDYESERQLAYDLAELEKLRRTSMRGETWEAVENYCNSIVRYFSIGARGFPVVLGTASLLIWRRPTSIADYVVREVFWRITRSRAPIHDVNCCDDSTIFLTMNCRPPYNSRAHLAEQRLAVA